MKVSLNWLEEFVDLPTRDPDELNHVLAMLGHEVEGVEEVRPEWHDVVVARVDAVEPHPNADRVRVCQVTTGEEPITVVCGAWNFEAGATVAFARPGAVLPGDFRIGVREIRGVRSEGMICSESELGIGTDSEGILVLDDAAPIGQPLEKLVPLPDVIFDLAITTNRPDAMSILGIARDLAAWYELELHPPQPAPPTREGDPGFQVEIQDPGGNPRFVARRLDDVTVQPSPLWMRVRLRNAGIRPISNLVDVTNYVMLELGQPLHVFDTALIAGNHLTVRRAEEGESLTTLDGVERSLDPSDLVICDEAGPISLAGVMGGESTEVSESTRSTLVEAAAWDPPSILRTSHRHGLRSEASSRFERGVDPELPPLASLRAAELLVNTAGGVLREGLVDEIARPYVPSTVTLEVEEVTRLLDDRYQAPEMSRQLQRLGFAVEGEGPLTVTVPSYRPDVTRPVDLVEELARLSGYDTFDERLRVGTGGGLSSSQRLTRRILNGLVSIGFSQAVTLPFVSPEWLDAFDPPPEHELLRTVRVKNPLSEEEAVLRPSLLPGLLQVIRHNLNRGRQDVAVFERGRVFHHEPWNRDKRVPSQPDRLAMAVTGAVGLRALGGEGEEADIHFATGLVRYLSASFGLDLTIEAGQAPGLHPTRAAWVAHGPSAVGIVGELHPKTGSAFGLDDRVVVVELDVDLLVESRRAPQFQAVSPYPPADFDLSFELARDVPAQALVDAVRTIDDGLIESVEVFDEFVDPGLGADRKALAVRVRLRAPDRTLSASEIAATRTAMIEGASAVGATLRGSS